MLGHLVKYPYPCLLVNGLDSGRKFVQRPLGVVDADALPKGLQLKPRMEEPVKRMSGLHAN
jgi:hypothetical protein